MLGNILATNGTYTLGDSTHYWLSGNITTLNLNSTASISGGAAGVASLTGKLNVTGVQAIYVPDQTNFAGSMFFGGGGGSLSHTGGSDGQNNVGVGKLALNVITDGGACVAIGNTAMRYNTTGYSNAAMGEGALSSNVSGHDLLAIGSYALQSSLDSFNVGIGSNAGNYMTSGDYNTLIGYIAGRFITGGSTHLTTLNQSVLIGAATRPKANNDGNEIIIGYAVTGNGDNTVTIGNSSITDNYILGNFNITDAKNFVLGTTTGTKFGTATTQKQAWWNATPVVQPAHIADPTGGVVVDAEARAAIASINALLATLGLSAAS
jgi:hypothetical protein